MKTLKGNLARVCLKSGVAIVALLAGSSAYAETATAEDGSKLEVITVTAQRYEQKLQDTPLSVIAVNANQLAAQGVESLQGLGEFVPNVTIAGTSAQGNAIANFSIRGIGGAPSGFVTQESAVGIYVDDVLFARPNGALLDLLDVERVEVLRGPQGTLFGRNTAAGAIRYVSKKPGRELEGNVKVAMGSRDRMDISGVLNVPLTETLSSRFSFSKKSQEGYIRRVADGDMVGDTDSTTIRGQFRWRPNDKLDVNFAADWVQTHDDGGATIANEFSATDLYSAALYGMQSVGGPPVNLAITNSARALSPLSVSQSNYCGQGASAVNLGSVNSNATCVAAAVSDFNYYYNQATGKYEIYGGDKDLNDFESYGLSLNIAYDFSDNLTFKSLTGYRQISQIQKQDWDRTPIPLVALSEYIDIEYYTQEFQLNGRSFDNRLKWVAGLFYYHDEADDRRFRSEASGGANYLPDIYGTPIVTGRGAREYKIMTTESIAAFAQGTFDVTEKLSVTLGLRYNEDTKDYASFREGRGQAYAETGQPITCNLAAPTTATCVRSLPAFQGLSGVSWDNFSARVGLEYRWNDDVMTYFSAAQGFKGGGFNDSVQTTCLTSQQLALPNANKLLANCGLSLFDEENLMTYEVGIRSDLFNRRARLNVTLFRTEYKDQQIQLIDVGPPPFQFTVNGDSTVQGVEAEFMAKVTDNLLVRANVGWVDSQYDEVMLGAGGGIALTPETPFFRSPELSYSIGANYSRNIGTGELNFDLNYGWKDEMASSPTPGNMVMLPSYGLLNARVSYESDKNWSVALIANNLTDEYYLTGGFDPGGPSSEATPGLSNCGKPGGAVVTACHDAVFGFQMIDVGRPREFAVELKYTF